MYGGSLGNPLRRYLQGGGGGEGQTGRDAKNINVVNGSIYIFVVHRYFL